MGAWGRAIGTIIGGLSGGPIGAGIGFALGIAVDSAAGGGGQPPVDDSLDLDIHTDEDDDGRYFQVEARKSQVSAEAMATMHVVSSSGFVKGSGPPFVDDDGDFVRVFPFPGGRGIGFVPLGALRHPSAGDYLLTVTVIEPGDSPRVIGRENFRLQLPAPQPAPFAAFLRPLIGLCMAVVRADDKVEADEIRRVRELLEGNIEVLAAERDAVRDILKTEPSRPVQNLAQALSWRMPEMPPEVVVEMLADIARADGHVDDREVEVIRNAALAFGLDPRNWDELARGLELDVADRVADAYGMLGLEPGASRNAIKKAYHAQVQRYHPDKVAGLPDEFQQVANDKSIELRTAYETLLATLR